MDRTEIGYSRLAEAYKKIGDDDLLGAATLLDKGRPENVVHVSNEYEIFNLNDVEYNHVTKDVILKRNGLEEKNLHLGAAKLIDQINRP